MSKKFFTIFFSVFLLALFLLPKLALADSEYEVQFFSDANQNGIYDPGTNQNEKETTKATVCYDGFVPCGKVLCKKLNDDGKCKDKSGNCFLANKFTYPNDKEKPVQCQLCHSFIMVDKAVDYVVTKLVPLLAILMLVIGGVMFYLGGVRPELLSRAKTLIRGVVIGLVLIYSAYMIVNIFLMVLGASEINSVKDVFKDGVFSVKCPVYVPKGFFQ